MTIADRAKLRAGIQEAVPKVQYWYSWAGGKEDGVLSDTEAEDLKIAMNALTRLQKSLYSR